MVLPLPTSERNLAGRKTGFLFGVIFSLLFRTLSLLWFQNSAFGGRINRSSLPGSRPPVGWQQGAGWLGNFPLTIPSRSERPLGHGTEGWRRCAHWRR